MFLFISQYRFKAVQTQGKVKITEKMIGVAFYIMYDIIM